MKEYQVKWEIDLDANSPRDAARRAKEIQRSPNSIANVFDVTYKEITRAKTGPRPGKLQTRTVTDRIDLDHLE